MTDPRGKDRAGAVRGGAGGRGHDTVMEDTQAVNWEVEEEEETERPSDSLGCSLEPLGRLHIFSSAHGPEKDFPLYLGKNVVGRMPDCSVALPFPSISKQHAVIEILAWDKAPVLRDCGSLNGTQILRPPKFLSPGVSHRLRDQEVVVFADLPCQYHRLDVSLPFFSRGPLTVEETPRVQRGTQPWGILLAEDSEEEVDPLSERYVVNEPRTMSSLLATVVPESDDEGPSAPDGPGPPYAFNFDSDTDEEERQQPATGWASSAATRDATAETEQPKAVRTEIQVEKDRSLGQESNSDIRVKRVASNGVILERSQPAGEDSETDVDDESRPPGKPAEGHLGRAQPSGFIDSDTDVEEEGIPTTPAVGPMKRRQIFHGVNAESPGEPDLAHLHESPAGSETDVEEAEAPLTVPLERSRASMVSDSNVGDEEGVSAPLTLAHLTESRATGWNRNTDGEEDRAQPPAFLEQSQTSAGRDRDTDTEVEGFPVEKREYVPKSHTDKAQTEKSQSLGDSDREVEEDGSSPGVLSRSQASATEGIHTPEEEGAPPGPAVTLPAKHGVPLARTHPTDGEAEGGPAKLPAVRPEEARPPPDTGTAGEPTQAQRKGALTPRESGEEPHVDMTKNSEHSHDDSEDLDQQATQCFVERESQSLEADLSMEEEPTQAFLFTLPREPGPSHGSSQASGALDEPWEVLATQPFCLREPEASETQPIAAHFEAHGSCPFSPRPTPLDQHLESPVRAEPLEIRGGGMQTAEKGMGHLNCKMSPAEKASRGDPGSLDVCLPPAVPEASAPVQNPLIPQNQKHLASQPLFAPSPPSLESPIPSSRQNRSQEAPENPLSSELDPLHAKPKCRPQGCSRMTPSPAPSIAPEVHPATSREQPVPPVPTSRATRSRTHRASVKTPEPTVPTAPDLEPPAPADQPVPPEPTAPDLESPAPTDQPVTPEPTAPDLEPPAPADQPVTPAPTSRATRGRTHRASVKTPEPTAPTPPDLEPPAPADHPVTSEPTSRATRGRTHRASVKTPEPTAPTPPDLEPPAPADQPVTPEPTSRATRGRTHRASVKTPEPTAPTPPDLEPPAPADHPVTSEPTSRATRGRTHRASVKTPEPTAPTPPDLEPPAPADQPVTPEPTSRATRGRTHRASVKTPEPTVPTDQPVTPEPTSRATRGRTHRASVKTPEPTAPTPPDLEPPAPTDQPVTPEPTSRATRGRTHRASVKTPEPTAPTPPDLEPPAPTDQPVTPKAIAQGGQSRTLRSTRSTVPVPTTPEFQSPFPTDQPIPPEAIPQANCSRRPRVARQPLAAPIVCEPCSAPLEPNAWSSRSQRRGAMRATKSLKTIPEPAFAQLPGAPTRALQVQKVEATGGYEFSPESQPKAFQNHTRPSDTVDSPPLPKRLRREVPQKTVFLKEEEDEKPGKEEDVVMPGPGKRKKDQAEEEAKGMPVRSLRRTKPNHESTAPKVLFTGVVDARGEQAVLALGGSLASSVAEASHLVTDRICRTVKFLCALGRGIPILSLDWLYQSRKAGCFLPPDGYVVTDPEQERNFGFSLRDSLSRARARRLLKGYEIHVTPGVQPPPPQMGEIISCCGGTVLPSMPRSYKPRRVVITCSQDAPRCTTPFRVGLPVVSPEFLLTGVLKQEANLEAFVLSTLEMSCP